MPKTLRAAKKPGDLHRLLESTYEAHRRDIYDYASGHLNPEKLRKLPKDASQLKPGKVNYWKSSQQTQSNDQLTRYASPREQQLDSMTEALVNFSSGTTGALPLLDSSPPKSPSASATKLGTPAEEKLEKSLLMEMEKLLHQNETPYFVAHKNKPVSQPPNSRKKFHRKQFQGSKKPRSSVLIEELKLPELMLPCMPDSQLLPASTQLEPGTSQKSCLQKQFITTHHAGVTRRDQFQKFMDFNRNILRHPETLEQNVREGRKAVQHLEHKLVSRLMQLQTKPLSTGPSFERLQLYAEIWSDLTVDSSFFGNLLAEIKGEYDLYLTRLLDSIQSSERGELARCFRTVEDLTREDDPRKAAEMRDEVEALEVRCMDALCRNEELRSEITTQEEKLEERRRLQQEEEEENLRRMLPIRRAQHKTPAKAQPPEHELSKSKQGTEQRLKALRVEIWQRLDLYEKEKKMLSGHQRQNIKNLYYRTCYVPKPVLRNLQHAVKDTEVELQKLQQQNGYLDVSITAGEATLETLFKKNGVDAEISQFIYSEVNQDDEELEATSRSNVARLFSR